MDLELRDKVVWIAGATGALGAAIARDFAAEGARTALSSRRAAAVAALAAELRAAGRDALEAPMDASVAAEAKAAATRIVGAWGRIDVLVTSMNVPAYGEFLDLDQAAFQATIGAKYLGYVACIQAALPDMAARGRGAIVCVTGTGGKMPIPIHMPGGSVNAAVNLIVRGLANRFGPEGVRINAVAPGPIRSPRQDAMQDASAAAGGRDPAASFPLRRFGEAGEVADAVLFLASDRASYITGTVLNVDGGGVLTL